METVLEKKMIEITTTLFEFTKLIRRGEKVRLKAKDARPLIDYIEEFEDFKIVYETYKGKTTIQKF